MIDFTGVKAITIPEGVVKQIVRKIDGSILWKSGFKNWVKYSTEADGVTIYNGGKGYKDGYRIRSGGAEGEYDGASHTGFIPLKAGDVVRLSGYNVTFANVTNAINVYDSTHTNIGQAAGNHAVYGIFAAEAAKGYDYGSIVEETSGVYVWIAPPVASIAFMRITGHTNGDGSTMIVTVNEEITL